jgi:exopolysaccharide biosynthesis predicted pyruvyltransferase EpsI
MLVQDGWEELASVIGRFSAGPGTLKYVPNHGNAGDALIAAGAWQFFDRLGVEPRITRRQWLRRGDCAIYAGGGNLVPEYQSCAKFLRKCLRVGVRSALVLPQTVRGHEPLLRELDARFTIACRDNASLERVRAVGTAAHVIAAPDLALGIDVERLFDRCRRKTVRLQFASELVRSLKVSDYLAWRRKLRHLSSAATGTVRIIRTDVESVDSVRGACEWDISNHYVSTFRPRNEADFITRDYLRFLASAQKVVTNRLHAGVAGALMGLPVTLMDNSYGKISAIYQTSLHGLSGVEFATTEPPRVVSDAQ